MKHNYAPYARVCLDCGLRLEEIVDRQRINCSRRLVKKRRYLRRFDRHRPSGVLPAGKHTSYHQLTDAERFLRWRLRRPFDLYSLALAVGWEPRSKPARKPALPQYRVL